MGRVAGIRPVSWWRGEPPTARIRYYRLPQGTPAFPIPHAYGNPHVIDVRGPGEDVGIGEAGVGKGFEYDEGIRPRWRNVTGGWCGSPEAFLGGRRGVDRPLDWLRGGLSTCCRLHVEGFVSLTEGSMPIATGAGDELKDGPIIYTGTGPVIVPIGLCALWWCIRVGFPADVPGPGDNILWVDVDQHLYLKRPDGISVQVGELTKEYADTIYERIGTAAGLMLDH